MFYLVIYRFNREVRKYCRNTSDDKSARHVGSVMNYEIYSGVSHNYGNQQEQPRIPFVYTYKQQNSECGRRGGMPRRKGIAAFD